MAGKEAKVKMWTLLPGRIKQNSDAGFVMLRDLLVLFVVIICAAVVLNALLVFVHQSSRIMGNTEKAIHEQNTRLEMFIK